MAPSDGVGDQSEHGNGCGKHIQWCRSGLFWQYSDHQLDEADIYQILPRESTVQLSNSLAREWEKEFYNWKTGGTPSLLNAIFRCYKRQAFVFALIIFLQESVRVGQALLLGQLIGMFEQPTLSSIQSPALYLYMAGICLAYLLSIILDHQYFHYGYRIRVALISLVYRKLIRLPRSKLTACVSDSILGFLSKGADTFPKVVLPAMYVLIGPLELIVMSYLLWDWLSLGPASVAGIGVILLLIPLQIGMGRFSRKLRQKCENHTATRLSLLHSVISFIQEHKMACMEKYCQRVINIARGKELQAAKKLLHLLSVNSATTLSAGKLVMFVTFSVFVSVSGVATAQQVFTALSLFEMLRLSVSILLPAGVLYGQMALKTVKQVQKILLLDEKLALALTKSGTPSSLPNDIAVSFSNYTGTLEKGVDSSIRLSDIDVNLEKGKLYTVIGPAGSGKTGLLLAILGELHHHYGSVNHSGKVAYISQDPWIFPGTIRDNIIFGKDFVRHRYTEILRACVLNQSLENLPQGDETMIGDHGIPLSNSLQVRIALARVVYQNTDILLMDGILETMDMRTASSVFEKCLCGLLKNKTQVLVTDSLGYVKRTAVTILMTHGSVFHMAPYAVLQASGIACSDFLNRATYCRGTSSQEPSLDRTLSDNDDENLPMNKQDSVEIITENIPGKDNEIMSNKKEMKSSTDVFKKNMKEMAACLTVGDQDMSTDMTASRATYWQYFTLGHGCFGIIVFIALVCFQQTSFFLCEWWLAFWPDSHGSRLTPERLKNSTDPTTDEIMVLRNVYIYLAFTLLTIILGVIQAIVFFRLSRFAAKRLHHDALEGLLLSPITLFQNTSLGTLMGHFSRDVNIVDFMSPISLDFIQCLSLLLGTFLLVSIINYWLFILVIPMAILFFFIRYHFMLVTRDLETMEIASKSSVITHISSSISGLQVIRSFNGEERLLHIFDILQDRSTAVCYLHIRAKRWFGCRAEALGLVVIIGVIVAAILITYFKQENMSAALLGLSLAYAVNLLNVLQPTLLKSSDVQAKMRSVERLLQCSDLPSEADCLPGLGVKPIDAWPMYGIITLEGMSYASTPKGPRLLKHIWCCIRAEEKVGILFKNPLEQKAFMSVLCRVMPYMGLLRIDGVDISSIAVDELRKSISVIPQDPPLLVGTIRQNLDPDIRYSDSQIWAALEQVQLHQIVTHFQHGMYSDAMLVNPHLTVGQRQLICLSRALLANSKIIIVEECVSQPDTRSAAILQSVSRSKFPRSTVIWVASLVDTIADVDRAMIFVNGKIKEYDPPYVLLQSENSEFYKMTEDMGPEEQIRLMRIAKDKYENRPYIGPIINPSDLSEPIMNTAKSRNPQNMNVLPGFHSSRLIGVLNQLPTNKFSINRL